MKLRSTFKLAKNYSGEKKKKTKMQVQVSAGSKGM